MRRHRFATVIRDAWIIAGITLALACLIEAGSLLAFRVRALTVPDVRVNADVYGSAPWVDGYYKEFEGSYRTRWEPFTYWRRPSFTGRYINVGDNGLRVTPQPDEAGSDSPLTIYLFGGSALWGTGARDEFTIPAILGRLLREQGIANRVVNYAQSGYVSSQELVVCMLELRSGHVPDVVIFYDGVNDAFSAYQQRVAGWPQNEGHRAAEFNLTSDGHLNELTTAFARYGSGGLATTRLLKGVLERLGLRRPDWSPSDENLSPSRRAALLDQVSRVYWGNARLVAGLGKQYGFRSFFYWQPTSFDKKHLTAYEQIDYRKWEDFGRFYLQASEAVRQRGQAAASAPFFHDLGPAVADTTAPVFVDFAHPGEEANAMIAGLLAADLRAAALPQFDSESIRRRADPASSSRPR